MQASSVTLVSSTQYYELRWPRFTKTDRTDGEPVNLTALQRVAEHAVGTEAPAVLRLVEHLFDVGLQSRRSRDSRDTNELDRIAREHAMWVRRLEEADGARRPSAESHLPQRRTTAAVAVSEPSGVAGPSLSFMTSMRWPADGGLRVTELPLLPTTAILRTDHAAVRTGVCASEGLHPATPLRNSVALPMKRSYSSPDRRSDAPSPSQRGLDDAHPGGTSFRTSDEVQHHRKIDYAAGRCRSKRLCVSTEQGGQTNLALGLRATLPTLLPSFLRPAATRPGVGLRCPSDSTASSVWTMVPSPPYGPERTPCHASLDRSNYVLSPLEVLRAAGHAVPPDADLHGPSTVAAVPASSPPPRMGYIFVAEERERDFLASWRRKEWTVRVGQARQAAAPKPVLVLTMDAFRRGFSFASAHARRSLLASA